MAMKNSGRLALTGIMTALALVFLFLSSVIPPTTVALAAAAGLCGIPVVVEIGRAKALLHYVAVSVLAFLLIPAVGGSILYVATFGHYTIFKAWVESKNLSRGLEWGIKLGLLSVVLTVGFVLLARVPLAEIFAFEKGTTFLTMTATFLLSVVVLVVLFMVYDRCMTGLVSLYHHRLRPHLRRLFHF